MDYLLIYLLLGCFSGFVAGLFGIGGGMVIVPILIFSFKAQHIHPNHYYPLSHWHIIGLHYCYLVKCGLGAT
jgi:uncharacterized membrane protein YfcA